MSDGLIPYIEYDPDEGECWNCGGDGYTYGCSWDWQCSTYDEGEGTCLCTRQCSYCNPPKPTAETAELQAVLAQGIDETPQAVQPEGREPGPKDAPK